MPTDYERGAEAMREPVLWVIMDRHGEAHTINWHASGAAEDAAHLNSDEGREHDEAKVRQRRPFRAVPLYARPLALPRDPEPTEAQVEAGARALAEKVPYNDFGLDPSDVAIRYRLAARVVLRAAAEAKGPDHAD